MKNNTFFALGLLGYVIFFSGLAFAQNQTCIVPSPPVPPRAKELVVKLPGDGGTTGCTAFGVTPGGATPTPVPISNGKCATSVQIADQSVANDNGWNDGGIP